MARYWNEEWPNMNSISIVIDGLEASALSAAALGILYRAAWFIAAKAVNSWLTDPDTDPRLPNDAVSISRLLGCSKAEWRAAAPSLAPFLSFSPDGVRLKRGDLIHLTRPAGRTPLTAATKAKATARWSRRCAYCGDEDGPFHFDHLYPVARGGTDEASNIVVACEACNFSKGSKTLEEWVLGRVLKFAEAR